MSSCAPPCACGTSPPNGSEDRVDIKQAREVYGPVCAASTHLLEEKDLGETTLLSTSLLSTVVSCT